MIKYILKCANKHEFESWFSNSNEYDKLKKKELIECIFCQSKEVEKSIMSPQISNSNSKNNKISLKKDEYNSVKKELIKIRKFVEQNFEFVGDKLANKVRDVYYDKTKNKKIYGTTTKDEREELSEEGIELNTIPWVEKDN